MGNPDSASAMSCAVGRLNAPVSWNSGAAGLVSGPRMLNTVRTPMAWRIGATAFIAGW